MDTILQKITDKIRLSEQNEFETFNPHAFVLKERPAPLDVLAAIKNNFFFIAEIKQASPSKGIIRENFDPLELAGIYQQNGASAISVITEEHFFLGKKSYLPQVKAQVSCPLLRKDFIIHPYQVYESYNLQADFLLLIAACLDDDQLKELFELTGKLGMHALIEIHNQEELERILPLNPALIGINNRDLKTFAVDLNTSLSLKPLIPKHIPVISESGIHSSGHIHQLKQHGFAGVLVGEYLLRQSDVGAAMQEMLYGAN
jgi:indole-3-glycerol phosphate synthase